MNDFPRARCGVRSVVILSWKWNGRGALLERRGQTPSPEPASSPGGAGSSAGLWALEVRGGRGGPGFLPEASWKPAALRAPGASSAGAGPSAEPEARGEGAPGAQFRQGSMGSRASLAWRRS